MANFIKIKAADIDGGTTNGSDILIGDIVYVAQGAADGTGSADTWNVMTSAGKSYTFTTAGKGLEWANQAISASGIKKVVDNVSKGLNIPCGCKGRRDALNKMFPYKK